jgi:hypothetical protein
MKKLIILMILFFISISLTSAFEFTLNVGNFPEELYEGKSATIHGEVYSPPENICNIKCTWYHSGESETFVEELIDGDSAEFSFEVTAGSSSFYNKELSVICEGIGIFCQTQETETKQISFTTTYCGDSKIQSTYENCGICPEDVGKCDLEGCIYGTECEGSYCIHEICWSKPYKENDGFCDSAEGENCKNSKDDCACETYERCSSSGFCETYCGNGQCEESERGICKSDCDWCGDGECNNNENCESCEEDCGVCENTNLNEQIANQTKEIIQQGLSESFSKQKMIFSIGAIVIVLFVVIYLSIKGIKHKNKNGKKKSKK